MNRLGRVIALTLPILSVGASVGTGFSLFYYSSSSSTSNKIDSTDVEKKIPDSFGKFSSIKFKFPNEETLVDEASFLIWQNFVEGPEKICLEYTFSSTESKLDYPFSSFNYSIYYELTINPTFASYFEFEAPKDVTSNICEGYVVDSSNNPLTFSFPTSRKLEASLSLEITYKPGQYPDTTESYLKLANLIKQENDKNVPFLTYSFYLVPSLINGGK